MKINVGFLGLLGLLFIGLRLGHAISWSWWLVLLPIYGPPAVAAALLVAAFLLALPIAVLNGAQKRRIR